MRKAFVSLCACALLYGVLPSCKKETVTNTVTVTDTVTVTVTDRSTIGLLTGKQWRPDTVYFNYPASPNLVYVRGRSGNSANLDNYRFVFWRNGKEDAFNVGGVPYQASNYTFTNTDSTILFFPAVSIYQRILELSPNRARIFDSTGHTYNSWSLVP